MRRFDAKVLMETQPNLALPPSVMIPNLLGSARNCASALLVKFRFR